MNRQQPGFGNPDTTYLPYPWESGTNYMKRVFRENDKD